VSTVPVRPSNSRLTQASLSDDDDENIERESLSIDVARQRFAGERVDADSAGIGLEFQLT
jgi:hypothetical protein